MSLCEKSLLHFIEGIKRLGTVKKTSYIKPIFQGKELFYSLTEKQRETILAAKKYGYYEYPRKINSEKLAKNLGISTPTVNEHLRKAENRLFFQILSGL